MNEVITGGFEYIIHPEGNNTYDKDSQCNVPIGSNITSLHNFENARRQNTFMSQCFLHIYC